MIVLQSISHKDLYGYQLVTKISEVVDVNEGTIYPLLKRLLNDHLLESYLKESTEGPPRKYYHITAAGISKYQELLKEWNEFSKRVSDFWRKRTMNKQEFLNQLEKKLDRINETERKDILMEYGTYIDDKMATGVSEEDAVSGFGDVDELAEEILDAYKINTDNVQTKVDKTLDKVYVRSESLLNRLGNLSVNDFFHIVFDAFVLLIILFIGKVLIVDLLGNLFISLLFSFSGGYLYFIENLLEFYGLLFTF